MLCAFHVFKQTLHLNINGVGWLIHAKWTPTIIARLIGSYANHHPNELEKSRHSALRKSEEEL